jgi:hypothetical protein
LLGDDSTPVVWSDATTVRRLHDILIDDHGFDRTDLTFDYVRAISDDKRTLVVRTGDFSSIHQLWALYLDKPLIAAIPEPSSAFMAAITVTAFIVPFRRRG